MVLSLKQNLQIFKQITINKFHIQNSKITNENFHIWYSDLKLILDSEELDGYISKNIKDININKKHLKYDSTVRIIILNSLDEYIKGLLNNCTSAYLMINELKGRFSETGPSRLFEIEMKIKKIEIENDDFNLYLDNLNSLFYRI